MPAVLPNDLRTSRLILRKPRPEDASLIFHSYAQDERVSRYLIWKPNTRLAETESFIDGCLQVAWMAIAMRMCWLCHPMTISRLGCWMRRLACMALK